MLTQDYLRSVLSYDAATGVFTWIANTGKKRMIGKVAGYKMADRRVVIRIDKRLYHVARLAWLYVHGEMPPHDVDHKDGDPSNNRLDNLRLATRQQNMANKRRHKNCSSGVKGVQAHKSGKWRAVIRVNGKNRHIGMYADKEEAGRAYFAAAQKIFGEFATVRG